MRETGLKLAPDVFVLGAMRVGTTLLYDLLREQDGIRVAEMKETDAYLTDAKAAQAATLNQKQYGSADALWVDISPNYSKEHAFPGVAERIMQANPDARFIYMVRNPYKRAESHLHHVMLNASNVDRSLDTIRQSTLDDVIETSCYYRQMVPYLELFPMDRFLFINFEDFVANPAAYSDRIKDHIGAPASFKLPASLDKPSNTIKQLGAMPAWWPALRDSKFGHALRQRMPRSAQNFIKKSVGSTGKATELPPLPQEVLKQLAHEVAIDIPKFKDLTGLDVSHWIEPPAGFTVQIDPTS